MERFSTAIVGGGASGIAAAIRAKRRGTNVVLLEKTPRLGKKVLASGNGRCNLSNDHLDPSRYNKASEHLVKSIFARFGKDDIASFFAELGVCLYADHCRVFPVTNQSATVLGSLELEMARLGIPVERDFEVTHALSKDGGFTITSRQGKKIICRHLIIATGGKSYPSFGSDGSGYALARSFGHTIIEPVPAAVPLEVKDPLCQPLQGQKIFARARAIIGGETKAEAEGELLFTKYGLSGTVILDISRPLSIAVNRLARKDAHVSVDLVPFMKEDALQKELERRLKSRYAADDLLVGILPNKFGPALKTRLDTKWPERMASALKDFHFTVHGTRGWNEADFTAGGVDTREVHDATLESTLKKDLYFCGEVLDVDGARGGYNLAWAWSSGAIAGSTGNPV